MNVEVRRADENDAVTVAKLAFKLVELHVKYDPIRFARMATLDRMTSYYGEQTKAKDASVLVAEIEKRIVGFAYLQFEERNYAALSVSSAWLHDIYVDEDVRHIGAGKKLIEAAKQEAKKFGAAKLLLSVAAKNDTAQRFFEGADFRTTMVEMMLELPG